jgi:hypoxanthine-DNA glycosylase
MTIEVHPFENFIPPNATHLVLGTFPTHHKNWRFHSYYPGRANFFWRMLSEIYRHPFKHKEGEEAAKERIALCATKGIAISDTIYRCRRKIQTSSKDSDLLVLEKMNILRLLKKHATIHTIILTGSSGLVSAHSIFFEHLKENNVPFELTITKPTIHGSFIYQGREMNTHTLYSTSGLNIGRYKVAVEQYTRYLPLTN